MATRNSSEFCHWLRRCWYCDLQFKEDDQKVRFQLLDLHQNPMESLNPLLSMFARKISEHISYDMSSGDIPKRAVCWKPILKLAIIRCFYTKYTYYILGTEHSGTFSQIYLGFSSPQNISNRTFWEPSLSSSQKPAKTGSDHNSYLGNLLAKVKLASSPKPYAKTFQNAGYRVIFGHRHIITI